MTTLFVTITLADADLWPALNERARKLGAAAAVLQGEGAGLVTQLDALAANGCPEVMLVGVTLGDGGVPVSWVGHVARWWLASNSDATMSVSMVTKPLRALPSGLPDLSQTKALRANEGGLANAQWEEPPPASSHLLVCRGPRCTAKGAEALVNALGAELHRRGMLDEQVLLTQTGCLFPCNKAPVVCVQPDMAWHGPVGVDEVPDFVSEHLAVSREP